MIQAVTSTPHPRLPGVQVFPLGDSQMATGERQNVLVVMEPGAKIPLHAHTCGAIMDPVAGSAVVLSDDEDNGVEVALGQRVHFMAGGLHGFQAGEGGFSFVSTNGGIVDQNGDWDITFVE